MDNKNHFLESFDSFIILKNQFRCTMKKWFIVVLIVAFAMIGIVSAAVVATQPIGGSEGYYDITSSPSGADVVVDGTSIGKTPATAIVMVTGTPGHTINVNKAGYEPWSQYYCRKSGRRTTHIGPC